MIKIYWFVFLWITLICPNSNLFAQDIEALALEEFDSVIVDYLYQGNIEAGLVYTEKAIEMAEEAKHDSLLAVYQVHKASFYIMGGAFEEAMSLLMDAKAFVWERWGETHLLSANVLQIEGLIYWCVGELNEGMKVTQEAARIRKKELGRNSAPYGESLTSIGQFYYDLGELDSAETCLLEGCQVILKTKGENTADYAMIVARLGHVYRALGDYSKTEIYYLKAKSIEAAALGTESHSYATSLVDIASLYGLMGRYEETESLYLEGLTILKNIGAGNSPVYASCLSNLATLYDNLGRYKESVELYLEAMDLERATIGTQHADYVVSLGNLAAVYMSLKRYEKAEEAIKEALKIEQTLDIAGDNSYRIALLEKLAIIYEDWNKVAAAEKLYLEALETGKEIWSPEHHEYADLFRSLSSFYRRQGQLKKAQAYCLEGLKSISPDITSTTIDLRNLDKVTFNDHLVFLRLLSNLISIADTEYEQQKSKKALERCFMLCQKAIVVNERVRHQFSSGEDKLMLLKMNRIFVEYGLKAAVLLGDEQTQLTAFQFADQNKSMILADALKNNRARTLGDLPIELVQKERDLQVRLEDLKRQTIETTDEQKKNALFKELNQLNAEMDAFVKSIKNQYPRYHQLKYEQLNIETTTIQGQLEAGSLFLEYFITDTITYVFAIGKDKVKVYPLVVAAKDLSNYIQKFRKSLTDYNWIREYPKEADDLYQETAYWLYQQLLAQPLMDFEAQSLVIVADGGLGHVPFEAFLVEPALSEDSAYKNKRYLLQDYKVSYNYSATLWKESLEVKTLDNNGKMLAYGATYDSLDRNTAQFRPLYLYKLREGLQASPAAIDEVTHLEQFFDGAFFQGTAANERSFKENAAAYNIIHLAMHGLLNTEYPILSSLAFTENSDTTEDNFLQAYEISKLDLNASLVVLSACETGYGKFKDGEGVMSLARSFMYAGTPSLVVSLWQVNDGSTALIMKMFYVYLEQGMTKDAALRQAKLDYIEWAEGVLKHPAFWSPFIQLGDNRPIALVSKANNRIYYGIGLVVLGLLLLFFFRGKQKEEA